MAKTAPIVSSDELYIEALTRELCVEWGVEDIAAEIDVEFSTRIRRSLGRTQPTSRLVRLNHKLQSQSPDLLAEVLCHELAHIVAHRKYGDSIRPHGPEWRSLVRSAGFEPSVRIPTSLELESELPIRCFVHRCPVCHFSRTANRPMRRWHCGDCVENGLNGELTIEEIG